MPWRNVDAVSAKQYRCGFCGYEVANDKGFQYFSPGGGVHGTVVLCPNCQRPTYFDEQERQYPGIVPGNAVAHLPKELESLYREARNCCGVSAFTASVLTSRKILMNIAVEQGAEPGLSFIKYVEYLAEHGYIPPNGKGWVDHIRKKGNEATHEISLMSHEDANELVSFVEMLLKFIYEFPNRVPKTDP